MTVGTLAPWLSPDPAGLAAVNPANPQTWNAYAYVANQPLTAIDALGLDCGPIPGTEPAPNADYSCNGPSAAYGSYWLTGGPIGSADMQQGLAAYGSWVDAMWLTGGAHPSPVNNIFYSIGWSITGGAGWFGPNGESLSASAVAELELPTLAGPAAAANSCWSPLGFGPVGSPAGSSSSGVGRYSQATVQACEAKNAAAVERVTGIMPSWKRGAYSSLNGVLQFTFFLPGATPASVRPGRYGLSSSPFAAATGLEAALHLPGPGDDLSAYRVQPNGLVVSSHIDDGLATLRTPLGVLVHFSVDVVFGGLFGLRPPCP